MKLLGLCLVGAGLLGIAACSSDDGETSSADPALRGAGSGGEPSAGGSTSGSAGARPSGGGSSGGASGAVGGGAGGSLQSGGAGGSASNAGGAGGSASNVGGTGAAGAGQGGSASGGAAGAAGGPARGTVCDHRLIRCRAMEPACPEGQVAAVDGTCYGACVRIDQCECSAPEECPHSETFTCIRSTGRCSYYLN